MGRSERIELIKYNAALNEIDAGNKGALKYLYDNYSACVGACVLERTKNKRAVCDIMVAFYERIWSHTSEFRASSGDIIPDFLRGRMKSFMHKRACPKCGDIENIYTITDLETPDMSMEEMERFDKELEEKKLCYGPDDKTYFCKACDIYY